MLGGAVHVLDSFVRASKFPGDYLSEVCNL